VAARGRIVLIVAYSVIDEASETICAFDAFVEFKIEPRRVPQAEPTTHLTAQESRGTS
jgi:hypothetical protein